MYPVFSTEITDTYTGTGFIIQQIFMSRVMNLQNVWLLRILWEIPDPILIMSDSRSILVTPGLGQTLHRTILILSTEQLITIHMFLIHRMASIVCRRLIN